MVEKIFKMGDKVIVRKNSQYKHQRKLYGTMTITRLNLEYREFQIGTDRNSYDIKDLEHIINHDNLNYSLW